MLTAEKLEVLLSEPTKTGDTRLMRLMSCDNYIKYIFVYYKLNLTTFEARTKASILKFSSIVSNILLNEGRITKDTIFGITSSTLLPTNEIITNAILELKNWYDTLSYINSEKFDTLELEYKVNSLSLQNYIFLTNFCGITSLEKGTNNSKIVKRFMNFEEQTSNFLNGFFLTHSYFKEVLEHIKYLDDFYLLYQKYEISNEEFLCFILLFDIRKNKNFI